MITYRNRVFTLRGKDWAYLFRVTEQGLLEHLHFGGPVEGGDAEALALRPGTGWGDALLYDQKKGVCLDVLPLEWSGSGRGDYRESPVVLEKAGEAVPTDFHYAGYRIHEGTVPMEGPLPQARDGGETLEIVLEHAGGGALAGLRLRLYYTVFDEALTRRAVLENGSGGTVTVRRLMSAMADLAGRYDMTTFDGGWNAEARRHTVPVTGGRVVNESTTGFSSNRHQPGFLLSEPGCTERAGTACAFNLVYTGNHYGSAQCTLQGLTRVTQGISPDHFRWDLPPGDRFETPEAVLCWSGGGFGGLSEKLHSFVNRHIIPAYWRFRPRPIVFNSWEGCGFTFDEARLLAQAKRAKELGCELFVLDDGWFGARSDDRAGLGDYDVNKKKLPGGLDGFGKKLKELGLDFGLWFEPESVNPDSALYRRHPDWALTDGLPPLLGRNQLHLDLTRSEVRDYIVENVTRVLDSAPISYVKWDMNRYSVALGARAHRYILGLYEVLGRIFGPRPELLLESCSSGGNRFDLGMLCFGPQVWCSDDTDPVERVQIQGGLSFLYPPSTFGAHVSASPHAQTLRATPLSTRGNVAFFGCLGYELDLTELPPVERQEIRLQTEFYRRYREVFQFGTFRRWETGDAVFWQVSRGNTHLVGRFHGLQHAAPTYERLRVYGLEPGKRYRVESRKQLLRLGQFGALVRHLVPARIHANGALLRTADRRFPMEDGGFSILASGESLTEGVALPPRFAGTGYSKELRVQSDFGSNLFVVKEVSRDGRES